jgi:hypothetical protein
MCVGVVESLVLRRCYGRRVPFLKPTKTLPFCLLNHHHLFYVFIGIIHFLLSTNQVSASASSLRGTSGSTTEDAGVSRRQYEVKRKEETDDL